MKKHITILTAFILLIGSQIVAQKILMKIPGITAPDGEDVRAVEYKITAPTSWQLGGGVSIAKPRIGDFLIKKTANTSSNDISKKILTGDSYIVVVFEYYDASDVLYFTITLKDAYISNLFWLSPECPTCLKLEHQVAFVPKIIETYDLKTGETVGYDVPAGLIY